MYRAYQIQRIKDGLCFECGKPRDNKTLRCEVCRKIASARSNKLQISKYREARIKGMCRKCGVPSKTSRCADCYEKDKVYVSRETKAKSQNALVLRREQENLCVHCGKVPPIVGSLACSTCLTKVNERNRISKKQRQEEALAAGRCMRCSQTLVGESFYCLDHYVHYILVSQGLSVELEAELVDKAIAQGMKCWMTGVPLVPGKNMSLEHIKPKITHSHLANELSNLVWTDLDANRCKRDMSVPELVKFAWAILEREKQLVADHDAVVDPGPLPAASPAPVSA